MLWPSTWRVFEQRAHDGELEATALAARGQGSMHHNTAMRGDVEPVGQGVWQPNTQDHAREYEGPKGQCDDRDAYIKAPLATRSRE